MIDVTIIVPVYNVEDYLTNCLNSLVEQDYDKTKIEIYIINDCSTDKSLKIIKDYMNTHTNIVLNNLKENHGVSYARNIGIKNANGQYIMFCDADDYYEKNAVSTFMSIIKKKNADFITANYFISNNVNNIKVDTSELFSKDMITKEEIVSYMTLTSCSKIIKREMFINNKILYPEEIKRCEELTVIPLLAYLADKPLAIEETLYHYYQRKTSASNSNNQNKFDYFDITFNEFCKKIDGKKYNKEIEFRAIDHLLYGKTLVMLKSNVYKKDIIKHIKNFKNKYKYFTKNEYFKKYNFAKKIFVYTLKYKLILIAKLFAIVHEKITG